MPLEKTRVKVSQLGEILEKCSREGGAEFSEGHWKEEQSQVDALLEGNKIVGGLVFRLYGNRLERTVHKKMRFYNRGGLVISRIHLILDVDLSDCFRKLSGLFFSGLYFENCTIEYSGGGFAYMRMPHSMNIAFRQTIFVDKNVAEKAFYASRRTDCGPIFTPWAINFYEGSSAVFENCKFGGADLQIQSYFKSNDQTPEHAVEVEQVDGDNHCDESNLRIQPISPEASIMVAYLNRLEFIANREIGVLHLLPPTREYVIRGGNKIESLHLKEKELSHDTLRMYIGLFEMIDLDFNNPYRHRELFLQIKHFATNCNDQHLLRSSTAQIERIELFLARQDSAATLNELGQKVDHWQRRIVLEWGWFCSNFHRSWLRCVGVFLGFYFISNVFICGIIPQCMGAEFWEVAFRPIPKIPFLVETIETLDSSKETSLTIGTKVWVGVTGILQTIFAGMCTFSLVKSLKP